jgi:transcriptional regulator GlxA family with amidase domain
VCTGAVMLAEAGLLDGKRATTHWSYCTVLAQRYPQITVDPDPIFIRDGQVYTSAGITAGMDLALALVEEDLGRAFALTVARWLVLFLKRPGGQSQFSVQLATQWAEQAPIRQLQQWVLDHLYGDLSVEALAQQACMSPRNFARVFAREVGIPPGQFVERARVQEARRQLEETPHGVEQIATQCGFGTAETLRRVFWRTFHVSPSEYRNHFQTSKTITE